MSEGVKAEALYTVPKHRMKKHSMNHSVRFEPKKRQGGGKAFDRLFVISVLPGRRHGCCCSSSRVWGNISLEHPSSCRRRTELDIEPLWLLPWVHVKRRSFVPYFSNLQAWVISSDSRVRLGLLRAVHRPFAVFLVL